MVSRSEEKFSAHAIAREDELRQAIERQKQERQRQEQQEQQEQSPPLLSMG